MRTKAVTAPSGHLAAVAAGRLAHAGGLMHSANAVVRRGPSRATAHSTFGVQDRTRPEMERLAEREGSNRRLETWKEIGSFLNRDARTVRRWESERGLPVRRVPGAKS